jgi:hypothetical protein
MQGQLIRAPVADIELSHNEETITFDISFFENVNGDNFGTDQSPILIDPLTELNRYWRAARPDKQTAIFNCFKAMRQALDDRMSFDELQAVFTQQAILLMELHSFEDMDFFIRNNIHMPIPADIIDVFDPTTSDLIGTRERTYVKEDYRQLIILALCIRPLGIVWGEYIRYVENEVGTVWKEYNAYQMLMNTWVKESRPFLRLKEFVDGNLEAAIIEKGEGIIAPAIVAGIGSSQYPDWLLSVAMLRRLVFSDLAMRKPDTNLIKAVYSYLGTKINNGPSSFKGRLNNKVLENDSGGEEGKLSILESYKSKIDLPVGRVAVIEHLLTAQEQCLAVGQSVQPDLDPTLLQHFLEAANQLMPYIISDGQVLVAQYTLSTSIHARFFPRLEKMYLLNALAITSAVLWQRGFQQLALLVLAYPAPAETGYITPDEPMKVSNELMERLESFYPYTRRLTGKQAKRQVKMGANILDIFFKYFCRNDWITLLPPHLLTHLPYLEQDGLYRQQTDLKVELARFLVDINERLKDELPRTTAF